MQKRGVCQGGKGGVLALAPPSAGVLPAGRRTERGRPKAAPWGTIFPDPISFDSAKRNGGKSHPGFSGQGFALRRVSFVRTKRNQKCAGGQARRNFKHQGRAFVPSACTPGPPFLRGPRIRSASHSVRRAKSGHPLLLFPLPLILAKTALSAAHGSAPGGAGTWIRHFFMQMRPECLSGSAPPAPGCWPGLGNR